MTDAAVVVYSRQALGERLASWPGNTGDVTWALVVAGALPSAAELAAALMGLLESLGIREPKRELEAYLHDPRAESKRLRFRTAWRTTACSVKRP